MKPTQRRRGTIGSGRLVSKTAGWMVDVKVVLHEEEKKVGVNLGAC